MAVTEIPKNPDRTIDSGSQEQDLFGRSTASAQENCMSEVLNDLSKARTQTFDQPLREAQVGAANQVSDAFGANSQSRPFEVVDKENRELDGKSMANFSNPFESKKDENLMGKDVSGKNSERELAFYAAYAMSQGDKGEQAKQAEAFKRVFEENPHLNKNAA
jgi:hypothetical protein